MVMRSAGRRESTFFDKPRPKVEGKNAGGINAPSAVKARCVAIEEPLWGGATGDLPASSQSQRRQGQAGAFRFEATTTEGLTRSRQQQSAFVEPAGQQHRRSPRSS
jgi:hypothetical protein